MGIKKGKPIQNLKFNIKVFPCLEYLWKQTKKPINMADNSPWWVEILGFKLDAEEMILNKSSIYGIRIKLFTKELP